MFRALLYLLLTVFLISVVRMFLGVIAKGFSEMMSGGPKPDVQRPPVPLGGELKRDPVCGTFVPATTSFTKAGKSGETQYFCSPECRNRYQG